MKAHQPAWAASSRSVEEASPAGIRAMFRAAATRSAPASAGWMVSRICPSAKNNSVDYLGGSLRQFVLGQSFELRHDVRILVQVGERQAERCAH